MATTLLERTAAVRYPEPVAWLRDLAPAVADKFRRLGGDPAGYGECLRWAAAACWAVNERGGKASVQAGAGYLRRVPYPPPGGAAGEEFGGDCDMTGHAFDADDPLTAARLAADLMPEFHAWVVVNKAIRGAPPLAGPELADFSAGGFPAACAAISGLDWEVAAPPPAVGGPGRAGGVNASGSAWYEPVAVCTVACIGLIRYATFGQLSGAWAGLPPLTGAAVGDILAGCGGAGLKAFPDPDGGAVYPDVGLYATGPARAFRAAELIVARDRKLAAMPRAAGVGPLPVG